MTPSLTEPQITALLRAWLLTIMPSGVDIVIAQNNRVPEPKADNYIVITPLSRRQLGTNVILWDESTGGNPTTQDNTVSTSIVMQLDLHGANATDNAQVFLTLFRSDYAWDYLKGSGLFPDYCTDGAQMPFINGENQYETRWVFNAVFDANITVTMGQQFANAANVGLIEVDTVYPP